MRERPILMSAPMVRALLDGRKTQTRRVVKLPVRDRDFGCELAGNEIGPQEIARGLCPYGAPGDRLWVRSEHYRFGHWGPVPGARTKTGRMKWRFIADTAEVLYDAPAEFRKGRHHKDPATPAWHKRLARFMPRALSRLTLEITDVRVQRLQEISEEDAKAEGIMPHVRGGWWYRRHNPADSDDWDQFGMKTAVNAFEWLWDSINGKRPGCAWSDNPWVWCLTFRRAHG